MLKIIVFEQEKFVPDEKFTSDAKEISDWVQKVLDDSPDTAVFGLESHKDSELLKAIKAHVSTIQINFVSEGSIPTDSQKDTSSIICGIVCDKGEITGYQFCTGSQIPVHHFSTYAQMKKLAEHINDF